MAPLEKLPHRALSVAARGLASPAVFFFVGPGKAMQEASEQSHYKLRGNDLELIDNYRTGTQRPCCEYMR